jgi:hypothetical protein
MEMINSKFKIGDVVYLKTDKEQLPRQVYAYKIYSNDITYWLVNGITNTEHMISR